jgi:hypothetical protein
MSRVAAVITNGLVTNIIELEKGKAGDSELDFRNAIEIKNPYVSIGWTYENNQFVAPPKTQEQLDAELEQLAKAEARSAAEAKLIDLGLTVADLKALLG